MRDHIISEIKRLAALNGQAPGYKLFFRETGIADHIWRGKDWARWSDALAEAGFAPNKWQESLDPEDVLTGVISACRHYGRFPTQDEIQLHRKANPAIPSAQAIKRHFGNRADLINALIQRASTNPAYADLLPILPEAPVKLDRPSQPSTREGFIYLFKMGNAYKIGRSADLERRVKEVGIKMPEKLELIHSIRTDDPPGIEAYWHRRFADKCSNGEWFKLTSTDISAFRKRKYQ